MQKNEELVSKFITKLDESQKMLLDGTISDDGCIRLVDELISSEDIQTCADAEIFTQNRGLFLKYIEVQCLLAKKLIALGNIEKAKELVGNCEIYLEGDEPQLQDKLEKLKQQIEKGVVTFPAVETAVPKPAAPKPAAAPAPKPAAAPVPKPAVESTQNSGDGDKQKLNKTILLAGAAAAVILLGGFFAFSGGNSKQETAPAKASAPAAAVEAKAKQIAVSFNVPQGTTLLIDGTKYAGDRQINLAIGKHKLELQHPLLEYTYDQQINITETSAAGELEIIKNITPGATLADSVKETDMKLINDILRQASANDKMNLAPELYTAEADKNSMLTKVHRAVKKAAIKDVQVNQARLGSLQLVNADGGKTLLVKTAEPVELEGKSSDGKVFRYDVQMTLKIDGSRLLLVSLDKFKLTRL